MIGAPCAGKSTVAAGLFHAMKMRGMRVELVTEFAKDVVWDGHFSLLEDQIFVFAEQHRRLNRLVGKVDYIITDSPLLLSAFYQPAGYPETFTPMVVDFYHRYDNRLYYLERTADYSADGRLQMEQEADEIAAGLLAFLAGTGVDYTPLASDREAVERILTDVLADSPGRTRSGYTAALEPLIGAHRAHLGLDPDDWSLPALERYSGEFLLGLCGGELRCLRLAADFEPDALVGEGAAIMTREAYAREAIIAESETIIHGRVGSVGTVSAARAGEVLAAHCRHARRRAHRALQEPIQLLR
nr:AAA family ATPase [Natronocella acetinitrilica]